MPTVTKFPSANQAAGAPFNGSWTNPNSAHTDNSTSATTTSASEVASAAPGKNQEYASVWNVPFSTSDIPNGSTVNSVTVEVQWRVSTTSSVATLQSTAFADSAQTTAVSASPGVQNAAEPTNLTTQTYSATPSLAQLRDLWVRVQLLRGNSNTAVTGYLDYVKVTVDYTAPPPAITGTGSVSFGFSAAGTGAFELPASTGTGSVTFGFSTSASGTYTDPAPAAISGSGGVSFSPSTSGSGDYTPPAITGTGGVTFGFSLDGSGAAAAPSVTGAGGVSFAASSSGEGTYTAPTSAGSGAVAFGVSTSGTGTVAVPTYSGTGSVAFGIAAAGEGNVSDAANPITGSGGVTFGFSLSGTSSAVTYPLTDSLGVVHYGPAGPWGTHGLLHYGHKPNH